MAGFCGACGSPRPDGANFCMSCGGKFPDEPRMCPTCGQAWPDSAVVPASIAVTTAAAPVPAQVPARFVAVRGSYRSHHGTLYYDGTGWFRARELPGEVFLPEPSQPLPGFDPEGAGLVLIVAEEGVLATGAGMPRGPEVGPDYRPDRDCGNCGFELAAGTSPCPHCGSTNTGAIFRPGG